MADDTVPPDTGYCELALVPLELGPSLRLYQVASHSGSLRIPGLSWTISAKDRDWALARWLICVGREYCGDNPLHVDGEHLTSWMRSPRLTTFATREEAELAYARFCLVSAG